MVSLNPPHQNFTQQPHFPTGVPNQNCFQPKQVPRPRNLRSDDCSVFLVEFVARGFATGNTDTSLWTVYNKGIRNYRRNVLPDGIVKNQKLRKTILTPTTRAADQDVPVTPDEIIERCLMTEADYAEAREKALSLFEFRQELIHDRMSQNVAYALSSLM